MESSFGFLDHLPTPILILNLSNPLHSPPLLLNKAWIHLTQGKRELSQCFSETDFIALEEWLSTPVPSQLPPLSTSRYNGNEEEEDTGDARGDDEMEHLMTPELLYSDSTKRSKRLHGYNAFEADPPFIDIPVPYDYNTPSLPEIELAVLIGEESGTQREMLIRWSKRMCEAPAGWIVCAHIIPAVLRAVNSSSLDCPSPLTSPSPHVISPAREARPIEERLAELEVLANFSAVGLARLDMHGRVLYVNDAWYRINGLDRSFSLDDWPTIVHPDSLPDLEVAWNHSLTTLTPFACQFKLTNGKTVFANATPNHSDPEKLTGWISNLTDITQAQETIVAAANNLAAATAADERRAAAEEQRRQQELLIDVTSHELRQPISAIIQCSELTRASLVQIRNTMIGLYAHGKLPLELGTEAIGALLQDVESLDAINDCGRTQEIIANDILGLAQIQINHLSVAHIDFDLSLAFHKIVRMFASECRTKEIELSLFLGASLDRLGTPPRIKADPTRLGQIIINLLANAIRFTAPSLGPKQISVKVEVATREPEMGGPIVPPVDAVDNDDGTELFLYFEVEDSGPGMSAEESGRIFGKFVQASPLTHCVFSGNGLGLFICRNLSELQGGRIEVTSELGVGSIFRGYISCGFADPSLSSPALSPCIRSAPPAVLSRSPVPDSPDSASISHIMPSTILPTPPPPPRRPLRVLAVDDNQINRKILRRQLESAGHSVETAENGLIAVNMFKDRGCNWDVIIMDVSMPVMTGIEATSEIRKAEKGTGEEIRIVGLTSNARDRQLQEALEAGMNCVVTKPYRSGALLDKLEAS